MAKVLLIATGGTIAMTKDKLGKIRPSISGEDLLGQISDFSGVEWEVFDFSNVASVNITPGHMLMLAGEILKRFNDSSLKGIIITHGTDTLEETAYFLDVTIQDMRPIVLTAAQRNGSEQDTDGPRNLKNALLIILHKDSIGRGTVVTMNDQIYAARDVRKLHTSRIDAFSSGEKGILGFVDNEKVSWIRSQEEQIKLGVPESLGNVQIVKAFTGMSSDLIDFILDKNNAQGLVIEAFGRGNLSPDIVPSLKKSIDKGMMIIITSRCYFGRVEPIYGYPGGGGALAKIGVWFAGDLSTEKVRILLSIALGKKMKREAIRKLLN